MKRFFQIGLSALLVCAAATLRGQIAITEYINNPMGTDTLAPEWVELFNYSAAPVDIQGWVLRDADSDSLTITTSSLVIPSGGFLILTNNKTAFEATWLGGNADARVVKYVVGDFLLGNNDDEIMLKDSSHNLVWGIAYPAVASGTTNGRATYLEYNTNFASAPTQWGVKGQTGVIRNGLDNITGNPLGYEGNNYTADALATTVTNANGGTSMDTGSPLAGAYNISGGTFDVGVSAILSPVSGSGLTANEIVTVTVQNFGTASVSALPIYYSLNGAPVKDTLLSILAGNTSQNFSFTIPANLATPGTYSLKAYTTLSNDSNPANDTTTASVVSSLSVTTDMGVSAITAPVSGTGLTAVSVSVIVNNYSSQSINSYQVAYTVNGGTPVIETVNTPLNGGKTAAYTFTNQANIGSGGSFVFKVYTIVPSDAQAANDTASITITNAPPVYDMQLTAVTAPVSAPGLTAAETITVSFLNKSNITVDSFSIGYTINGATPVIEKVTTPTAAGATGTFSFVTKGDFSTVGNTYTLCAFSQLLNDVNAANDTTCNSITHQLLQADLGITAFLAPQSAVGLTATEAISVRVKNFGNATVNSYSISYTLNGGAPATETVNTPLAAGDSVVYTFATPANLSTVGAVYSIVAYTLSPNDISAANDTLKTSVTNVQPYVAPATLAITEFLNDSQGQDDYREFIEIFNYGNVAVDLKDWMLKDENNTSLSIISSSFLVPSGGYVLIGKNKDSLQNEWFAGVANANIIGLPLYGSSGTGGVFNMTNGSDQLILTKPDGTTVWSLAYRNDGKTGKATFLDYTTDFATTPTIWGSKAKPGIVRAGADSVANFPLGYEVNTATADAFAINSFWKNDGSPLNGSYSTLPLPLDAGVTAITAPVSGTTLTNAETVTITVKNFGSSVISNFLVHYTMNGSSPVSEIFTSSLAAGATASFSFAAKANLSGVGAYNLKAYTDLVGDGKAANDTATALVVNGTVVDMGVDSVILDYTIAIDSFSVVAVLRNYGNTSISGIPVSYLSKNLFFAASELCTKAINPGDTAHYAFKKRFPLVSIDSIYVTVSAPADVNAANNQAAAYHQFIGITPNTFYQVLELFPNPAKDAVRVVLETAASDPVVLELYNALGQSVARKTFSPASRFEATFDVSKLPAGIYTLSIQSGMHVTARRLVVE